MKVDVTQEARYFLACLYRLREKHDELTFSLIHILNILRGENSQLVLKNKDDEFKIFGWGKNRITIESWLRLSQMLLEKEFIDIKSGTFRNHGKLNVDHQIFLTQNGETWLRSTSPNSSGDLYMSEVNNDEDEVKPSYSVDEFGNPHERVKGFNYHAAGTSMKRTYMDKDWGKRD